MSESFYPLEIKNIEKETIDCVSISFIVPDELKEVFHYTQGQYLTLRTNINNQEIRRAYSLSSAPFEEELTVSVKQVPNGKMSTHLCSHIKVGDRIETMPPNGRFFTPLSPDAKKTYYFFCAGSGITPIISIMKTIIEEEPLSTVFLLYGNRDEENIIFKSTLDHLQEKYRDQIIVDYILSQPKRNRTSGIKGFWSKANISWQGKVGRIGLTEVSTFLEEHPTRGKSEEYFICGPGEMITLIQSHLESSGISTKNIHHEFFTTPSSDDGDASSETHKGKSNAIVTLNGTRHEFVMERGDTILKALQNIGVEAPYSCGTGACSTCMARVKSGKISMDACFALDDDEVENGYILTCQSHPTTESIEITFDE
ncbi:MAG: ferredoxin--NADP reductase [Saprospiraceae bacterium]|nr:ferredoxin--NADP reductase [Saprospiraceae bacterium]